MELSEYIKIFRRWWWVIAIAGTLSGSAAYIFSQTQAPLYQSEVKIFIGGFIQDPNPVAAEIQTGTDLAPTYANLVTVRPILESVIARLDLDTTPETLSQRIRTRIVPETSILIITITDENRVQSANIANELANELIRTGPTSLTPEEEARQNSIADQINFLFLRIESDGEILEGIEAQLLNANLSPEERNLLTQQRTDLLSQISGWQQSVADLSDTLNAIATQTNRLSVVEPAIIPQSPVAPNIPRNVFLGILLGVISTTGLVILFEYLDTRIHSVDELREKTTLPVFASISRLGGRNESYTDRMIMLSAPNSAAAEGYRTLRTNLLFGYDPSVLSRLVVTSSRPEEGKTVTSCNLAIALARAEYKTVLIDADLHRPQVHNAFNLPNNIGLGNLFEVPLHPNQLLPVELLSELMQPTQLDNLRVITSGSLPSNPAELFGLAHLKVLCDSIEQQFGVDVIIFDTPPILSLVDSLPLASNVKASVVVVVRAHRTYHEQVKQTLDRFGHVGVNVVGFVLNNVKWQTESYYYYGYSPTQLKK